ncbi:MAG: transglycosylase SLT domain-containing protein [Dechloromonas sp.]|nr:transglycosylase SLT domain-containing protein [Candidatus Dechloromonas phosphoritropha]MBP8787844.1 transglycosylase SLT domain-containing protein [Azonexus sp.]MBP9228340.1 transglycosylase SLT domain-containing protein [Azonexus sp.]
MHDRNVLSLVKGFTGFALISLTSLVAAPVLADGDSQTLLLSMLAPSNAASIDNALTVHEVHPATAVARTVDLTIQPDDLWVRLRHGFAMTNLDDDLTLHYQQWYQNRPDALRRMVERSRPYLHYIVEELEARGMPTEIALLPMVESSFNPMAYSRSHASGLWQFIPATGKRFNLEQTWWQDQRRDIVASTDAALEYLQAIYEMHGDWHLALASYNWGEGAVKRAIEKNQAKGLPTDYVSLTMPNETRHYVPKLQALKNIFSNPVLMIQLGLPEIINRPYFATVGTSRPMDVKTAARLANMPIDEFLALNPSHNRPVMKADTPVVLPAEKLATFQRNLEKTDEPLTEWQAYTLKSGEKLDQVAPRFGIALADLQRANGLKGNIKLAGGSTLLVPAGKGADDLDSMGAEPSLPQIVEPEPPPVKAPVAFTPATRPGKPDKASNSKAADTKVATRDNKKDSGKLAAANTAKVPKAAATDKPKVSTAKPAAPVQATKVAKSGNGRRS